MSVAAEQSRRKTNLVAQGDGTFGHLRPTPESLRKSMRSQEIQLIYVALLCSISCRDVMGQGPGASVILHFALFFTL